MIFLASADPLAFIFFLVVFVVLVCSFVAGKQKREEARTRRKLDEEQRQMELRRQQEEAARRREEAARIRDEKLKAAMLELENETYDRTLWAKALIMADGSPSKAKALYLRLRIGEL